MLVPPDQTASIACRASLGSPPQWVTGRGLAPLLRPMREGDLGFVAAVEQLAYASPWSEGIFRDCLTAGYSCWVISEGERLLGHGVLSVVLDECHLLNLCIAPHRQRQGLGRDLLGHLLGMARERGVVKAFLEVRVSNGPAIGLYRSAGFQPIGQRRGYYPDGAGREDALILSLDLA